MNIRRTAIFLFVLLAPGMVHAKLFLLLDERLKKSRIEQVIYKFVPMTNASEVELNYVQAFMKDMSAASYATRLKGDDRGLYIGADSWPEDSYVTELTQGRNWAETAGKISFLVESSGPEYARMPKGLYPRRDLWRKYAELTHAAYAGSFYTHYLDTTQNTLPGAEWRGFTCVHESGRELRPGKGSPLTVSKNQFQLSFRQLKQLNFTGALVCINTPKADTMFEVHTAKTDVALEADAGKFSLWNEAQPLRVRVISARQITAPLELEIRPEVNDTQTEFFFQGERITCTSNRCRKKDARFLLPQFRDFNESFELAIRASGDSYFRGTLRLMSGEIEIARTSVRFTPQSRVAEVSYALRHPSEYQSAFFIILGLCLLAIALVMLAVRVMRKLAEARAEKPLERIPKQSSASVVIEPGITYRMTAGENPFGCELYLFGGIVALRVEGDAVAVSHAGAEKVLPLENFRYDLPDGYTLEIRVLEGGALLLRAYLLDIAVAREKVT
ncbi:MAG: hypothetical protein J0L53_09870 [Spirochaetes bacterium]|nr:hypothetical protein [Spirochaetota bacterium]